MTGKLKNSNLETRLLQADVVCATGSGVIDEDDLRSVANELKKWKQ